MTDENRDPLGLQERVARAICVKLDYKDPDQRITLVTSADDDGNFSGPEVPAWEIYKDAAKAAIAECDRWLPIDQAKKDGTAVLVTRLPATTTPPVSAVRWCRGPAKSSFRWRVKDHERTPLRYKPTHFQHITPPEAG